MANDTSAPWRRPRRWLRHLTTDERTLKRLFGTQELRRIEAVIAQGERTHRGQLRFAVEPALPLPRVWSGLSPRDRALEVFGLSRTWDTEENSGVLLYLLLADRDVEIVADRGIHACVPTSVWEGICRSMEEAFAAGRFAAGVEAGLAEINTLLATHFPRREGGAGNELPDKPLVL